MNFKKPNIFQYQQTRLFLKKKVYMQLILEFKVSFKKYRPVFSQNPKSFLGNALYIYL